MPLSLKLIKVPLGVFANPISRGEEGALRKEMTGWQSMARVCISCIDKKYRYLVPFEDVVQGGYSES